MKSVYLFAAQALILNQLKDDRNLSVVGFKNYLFQVLSDLKKLYEIKNKPANFDEWNDLFVLLEPAAVNPDGVQLQPQVPRV